MKFRPLLPLLKTARDGGPLIGDTSGLAVPTTLEEAYAIADRLMADEPIAGYKIGATTQRGREVLGVDAPFFGRIARRDVYRSPVTLKLTGRSYAVEAEIGCELGNDLPPRGAAYTRAEVIASVRRVVPLVELNQPSFTEPFKAGGLCLIADNGVNAGAVIGAPGSVGLDAIQHSAASLSLNGSKQCKGSAARNPDDPLSMLTWLANFLSRRGVGLCAGQIVATGAMTAPLDIDTECTLEADYGALGRVQVQFVA
jgi:2-keto-4-pentenoate hydratase